MADLKINMHSERDVVKRYVVRQGYQNSRSASLHVSSVSKLPIKLATTTRL
jgi:hypothetical protein